MIWNQKSLIWIFFIICASSTPLLAFTRPWGRCWAAIQLCCDSEPSSLVLHREVNGLDIQGQHGKQFVSQHLSGCKRAIPHICKQEWKGSTLVQRWLSWFHAGPSRGIPGVWVLMSEIKVKSHIVFSIYSAIHQWSAQTTTLQCDELLCSRCKWVIFWDAVHFHSVNRLAMSGPDVQAPWHFMLETAWQRSSASWTPWRIGRLFAGGDIQSQFAKRCCWLDQWGRCEHYSIREECATLLLNDQR